VETATDESCGEGAVRCCLEVAVLASGRRVWVERLALACKAGIGVMTA